jgi:uncharacterized membrane protein
MSATTADPRLVAGEASERVISKAATSSVRATTFVYGFAVLYAAVFAAAAATSYLIYLEPRFDLGNRVQVVWSTAHGNFLQTSDAYGAHMSRLGSHFDPFLVLLVPLWWAWSSPLVLLIAQAVAVAAGALPVYWLARKHLHENGFAVVFAAAYLLYPATQFNAFTPVGIHAVSFAIPLILFAIWFLDEGRLLPFAVFALVAATTKEEIAAAVGGLGIWYAVRHGRRRAGAAIFVLGVLASAVLLEVVIPHYAPSGTSPFAGRYAEVGSTPTGMLHVAVTDPGAFVHQMATWHKLLFLVLVFAPFLGLWALEPLLLVGALPDLVINLLSAKHEQTTIFYQYTAGIIPFVVAASVLGAAKLRRRRHAPTALLATIGLLAIVSPLIYTISSIHSRSDAEVTATRNALKLVPPRVAVSASQTLGAYVSTRKTVAVFPNVRNANWVLVGRIAKSIDDPHEFRTALRKLRSSDQWRVVFDSHGVTLFVRTGL